MRAKPTLPILRRRHYLGRHLRHAWTLHEGSGSTTHNVASRIAAGTLTGAGVTWQAGRQGWAVNQTATAAHYIAMPSLPVSRIIPARFTVIFGYNPGASADRPVFGFLGSSTSNAANPFQSYDSGVNIGNGSTFQLLTALPNGTANTVNVYAITDDGTNYTVYKDGIQQTQNAITVNPASGINRQFCIGGSGMTGSFEDNHAGSILWFYIFDRGFSRADVAAIGADPYQMFVPALGDRIFASVATTPAPPTAPSGLTATANGAAQIDLAWTDNSGDEDNFEVERSPNGSTGWTQIATPAADATSYSDTELDAATTYYYRVRAVNIGGNSSYSNTDNATTAAYSGEDVPITANLAAAWSARQLREAYAGDCLRLRRDSDDAESDFGFDGTGSLKTTEISDWLSGATGYLVTLYDQSGNGYDATQSTAASQPQYIASGSNGLPAFSFDGSDDYLDASGAAATFSGADMPLSMSAVVRGGATGTFRTLLGLTNSADSDSLQFIGVSSSGNLSQSRRSDTGSGGTAQNGFGTLTSGTYYAVATSFGAATSQRSSFINGTMSLHPAAYGSLTVTVDTVRIGSLSAALDGTYASKFNGYLSELVVYSSAVTSPNVRDLALYHNDAFAVFTACPFKADNAADHLEIPVYIGGDFQAIHPDVYDSGSGNTTDGHRFWMVHTPYPSGNSARENPSIVVSDAAPAVDQTWSEPAGITNPIAGPPGTGNYGDADLILGQDGNWYVYYFWNTTTDEIRVISSSDGVTWGSDGQLFTVSGEASPMVLWDGSQYVMYTVDTGASPNGLKRRTSASPDSGWSSASTISMAAKSGREVWDSNIIYDSSTGTFHGFFTYAVDAASGTNTVMYYGESANGTTWTVYDNALLNPSHISTNWDGTWMYRAAAVKTATGFDMWYSANGNSDWHTGYTAVTEVGAGEPEPSATVPRSGVAMLSGVAMV